MKKLLAALFVIAFASAAVAQTINNLGAGGAVSGTDMYPSYQGSNPATRVTADQIKTYTTRSAVRSTTGVTATVLDSDQGKLVTFSNGSAVAADIAQAGGGGSFVAGWVTSLKNLGAGTVTLTPATSVIDGSATTLTLLTGQGVDLYSDGSNYFTQPGRGAVVIARGTAAMSTSAIGAGACASAVTALALGVATTDVISVGFNGDPTSTVGYQASTMLTIVPYPTANTVNFKSCNLTSASITASPLTINWRVDR